MEIFVDFGAVQKFTNTPLVQSVTTTRFVLGHERQIGVDDSNFSALADENYFQGAIYELRLGHSDYALFK